MDAVGVERVVRAAVTTYVGPDGVFRHALRGQTVEVSTEGLARWDELDGQDPAEASVRVVEPVRVPVERHAPVDVKRGPGRPRKDA